MNKATSLIALPLICLAPYITAQTAFEFRGPDGMGHYPDAENLPTTWSDTENVTWKIKLPGHGHSSPVFDGKLLWLTTAFETEASEEESKKRLEANTGNQPLTVLGNLKLHALGINPADGSVVHNTLLLDLDDPQWVHQLNSYASPTPLLDENGRLYCHFGTFGNACVDTKTGKLLWTNTELEIMHENGPGGSPVLYENRLIMNYDGSDVQFVAALDTDTGKVAWKTTRSGKMHDNVQFHKAYATPLLADINGKQLVLSPGADWLYGYDPANGNEVWKVPYEVLGFSNVSRPIVAHGKIYMATCYMKSELLVMDYADKEIPEIAWRYKKGVPSMGSPLIVDSELYFIDDRTGIMTCLDALTGDEIWRERLGGSFGASPTFADGKIYCGNREGEVTVLAPGKEFKVLAKNTMEGRFFASPIVADNALFLRTDAAFYRVESK